MFVILLAGPPGSRDAAIAALQQASFRVSKRTDSGNLADEGLAWIRTYAEDPYDVASIAIQFDFAMRSYSVPIMRVEDRAFDPVEADLMRRLEAEFEGGDPDGQAGVAD
jgi:hypothetical protein